VTRNKIVSLRQLR